MPHLTSPAELAACTVTRIASLSTGDTEFVVVVRYIREPNASKQFRTMRVQATEATAEHTAQMSVMQLGPRATVHTVYPAAQVGC